MKKIKIQIKNRFTGNVLFEHESENNTIKETLENAVKNGADLYGANLYGADLYDADLRSADLRSANLYGANLSSANLYGADLRSANLYGANLSSATNILYISYNCPSDGSFVGWKKVNGKLIKLLIPEDALRCSATTMKCRCDKAKVLDIMSLDEMQHFDSVVNEAYSQEVVYKVGEMVYPDKFDENRWNECSKGIHFFINKQDAINY